MAWDADLETMLADFGVPAVHGAETGKVIVDTTDEAILQAGGPGVGGKMVSVLCRTSDFSTLKIGDTWTVDGAAFKVADRLRLDDGLVSKVLCRV